MARALMISATFPAHQVHETIKRSEGANPDLYACVKELFPVLAHNDIQTLTLNGSIPSTLDRYSMLNLKELLLYNKYAWRHWSASATKLAITITSATRADVHVVRELTFEGGKPGILLDLQRLRWRAPEGICTFQDNSLLKMASSRRTRCPGSFIKLMVKTKIGDRDVLSEDIITRVKGLRKIRAVGVTL
ncbi:hypothetical protein ARMSODRAFT_983059 [Armillaria solidipes]|uniref:Uncharacterized protein n=1 Tax=Armillaria solidipes TaxID=1076256 RepID=A0A2H3AKI6_9AGAR|nr:hypothetical protein ARMSODRAFT_983059 [Armillaria solidipes]